VGDRDRCHLDRTEHAGEVVDGGEDLPVDRDQIGEVVVHEPERRPGLRVPRHDHHALAGHASELGEAADTVGPVMHGEDGQRGGEAGVAERQGPGRRLHDGSPARRALHDHRPGGLRRDHGPIGRLVGARTRADVEHARRVGERGVDDGGDAGIGTAIAAVADAEGVVQLAHQRAA
jgi:hypothetical protein